MLSRTTSYTTFGLDALPVHVEVDAGRGLPALAIVGLPDQAVKEARERVRSAILNSQYQLPSQRFTINLAPADLKKEGGMFDLAIALGILAASGQLDPEHVASIVAIGELALDGSVRPIHGALPVALALRRYGGRLLLPPHNAPEAAVVDGLDVIGVPSLRAAAEFLAGSRTLLPQQPPPYLSTTTAAPNHAIDFSDIKGQAHAKRALEIAAAGRHHVLLVGPPGAGKTMLAQRIPTIQPELTLDEALETTKIHSIAGLLHGTPLIRQRPFRAPHHTSSAIALVGGGSIPKPGEASLAHHGVLFLDELPEFHRDVLESLREPLESGTVHIARAKRSLVFPASFLLIGAMNPCPCGHLTDPQRRCRCSTTKVQAYLAKISGPLLDRIDLHVEVPAVPFDTLTHAAATETSTHIRHRVLRASARQYNRLAPLGLHSNAQLRHRDLAQICPMTDDAVRLLRSAMQEFHLSARSYDKILKIGRTIADLADQETLQSHHLAEAIQYRTLDRQLWV